MSPVLQSLDHRSFEILEVVLFVIFLACYLRSSLVISAFFG